MNESGNPTRMKILKFGKITSCRQLCLRWFLPAPGGRAAAAAGPVGGSEAEGEAGQGALHLVQVLPTPRGPYSYSY